MLGEGVKRRQGRKTTRRPRAGRRSVWRWLAWPLAVLLPGVAGYLIATLILFPPREVSGAGIPVPGLVGLGPAEAQRQTTAAGLGPIDVTEIPHPDVEAGRIIAQDPLPGQQLRPGAEVRVAISAGRPRAAVPDVAGYTAERAQTLLGRAGFQVTLSEQQSGIAAGRVLRTEPGPGNQVALPASVRIIVSSGPPQVPDTLSADTLPPPDMEWQ